ncbi:hypothetical protein KRR38_33560 [Novosphingobium sp. G106]|uniref:hypothetical protein n=1 Tax=Novosphingobium sp. G106 TaxID=2849500 RepID=UPI001C2D591E|nr:hypothetical protein [Novosphingobium sp. G106]MBV1692165.1 hypothetical protein [Novosphingobium sp. G106]MBV1692434.1 hypothetical protein [Novosphingobium sp. G106]
MRRRAKHLVEPILSPIGTIERVRSATPAVALTFDDGPDDRVTPIGAASICAVIWSRPTWRISSPNAIVSKIAAPVFDIRASGGERRISIVGFHCG